MKLTIDQIREVTTGAAKIDFQDGMCHFFRFNSYEAAVIDNPNVLSQAGIQMKFKTDGSCLKLKIHTKEISSIRSYFSFDVFVNGVFVGAVQNIADEACTGDYANQRFPLGTFQKEFALGEGEKLVKLVFPHSVIACIEELALADATYIKPVRNEKTILYYGDSITQGYDAVHPSESYAARLAEALDADIINKALGGAVFCPELVQVPVDSKPDCIVVAYGTNDWNSVDLETFRRNAEGFLNGLQRNYAGIPVFVITPIWRNDWRSVKKCGAFFNIENAIVEIFGSRENITVIPGFDLIPHDENLYGDLWVHPNGEGFAFYSANLKKRIVLSDR